MAGAAPLVIAGRGGGVLAHPVPSGGAGGLSIHICGRLVNVPNEASASLSLMSRHLAAQLKISGHGCLQISDVNGVRIANEQELAAAVREGRHPFQASMTVGALREIEQKKSEVETKKEELAQFQWQVVVDQIAAVGQQVAAVASQLQSVKDECQLSLQQARGEEIARRERMEEAIMRESNQRELSLKDVETKIDKLVQAVCAERSARDVGLHQLGAQVEQVRNGVEADRSLRAQERAQTERLLDAMRHQVEAEAARNEEQWNWHMEASKRLDLRLEDRASTDLAQQVRLTEVEAATERLRASVGATEAALAMQKRAMEELMHRRGDELSKAVRDEMVGRENHIARFAKELETSWQSLEARMQRIREEASGATAAVAERARLVEQRCGDLERDFMNQVRNQSDNNQFLADKVHAASNVADAVEMSLKSTDVVAQTTATRVDDLVERMANVETDLRQKVRADYWQPQMDALQRNDQKLEAKLTQMEKDLLARLAQESAHRDGVRVQLQDTMKNCMDKIVGAKPSAARFVEVAATPPAPSVGDDSGMTTPRCIRHVAPYPTAPGCMVPTPMPGHAAMMARR